MIQPNLTRPIAFFDLETTGVNVASDRIVEISILKISPDGSKEIKTKKINPTIIGKFEIIQSYTLPILMNVMNYSILRDCIIFFY